MAEKKLTVTITEAQQTSTLEEGITNRDFSTTTAEPLVPQTTPSSPKATGTTDPKASPALPTKINKAVPPDHSKDTITSTKSDLEGLSTNMEGNENNETPSGYLMGHEEATQTQHNYYLVAVEIGANMYYREAETVLSPKEKDSNYFKYHNYS